MSSDAWINWGALGKILGVGLLAGAGLPALFAIGLRLVSSPTSTAPGPVAAGGLSVERRAAAPALVLGGILFAIVLAALGYGIYLIVNG
ncbi:MAG: hypothetical protein JWN96_54 [Mycobacterium sp.]|jgi:hypothetical protein|nr:hypothetical protein [Mycobacterium sp.]